jgi:predicted nucleic acid-binding protein
MIRVFMDSSALFAAVVSPSGAARELIRLAINEEIQLIISQDVVTETQRNLGRKMPEIEPLFAKLLEAIDFEIVPDPPRDDVWAAEQYVA